MVMIIRLQNLSLYAKALDIRRFFEGLSIPDGGVHIIGGEKGDAFVSFSTDEDARRAMSLDGEQILNMPVRLLLSSNAEMQKTIAMTKTGVYGTVMKPATDSMDRVSRVSSPLYDDVNRAGSTETQRRAFAERDPDYLNVHPSHIDRGFGPEVIGLNDSNVRRNRSGQPTSLSPDGGLILMNRDKLLSNSLSHTDSLHLGERILEDFDEIRRRVTDVPQRSSRNFVNRTSDKPSLAHGYTRSERLADSIDSSLKRTSYIREGLLDRVRGGLSSADALLNSQSVGEGQGSRDQDNRNIDSRNIDSFNIDRHISPHDRERFGGKQDLRAYNYVDRRRDSEMSLREGRSYRDDYDVKHGDSNMYTRTSEELLRGRNAVDVPRESDLFKTDYGDTRRDSDVVTRCKEAEVYAARELDRERYSSLFDARRGSDISDRSRYSEIPARSDWDTVRRTNDIDMLSQSETSARGHSDLRHSSRERELYLTKTRRDVRDDNYGPSLSKVGRFNDERFDSLEHLPARNAQSMRTSQVELLQHNLEHERREWGIKSNRGFDVSVKAESLGSGRRLNSPDYYSTESSFGPGSTVKRADVDHTVASARFEADHSRDLLILERMNGDRVQDTVVTGRYDPEQARNRDAVSRNKDSSQTENSSDRNTSNAGKELYPVSGGGGNKQMASKCEDDKFEIRKIDVIGGRRGNRNRIAVENHFDNEDLHDTMIYDPFVPTQDNLNNPTTVNKENYLNRVVNSDLTMQNNVGHYSGVDALHNQMYNSESLPYNFLSNENANDGRSQFCIRVRGLPLTFNRDAIRFYFAACNVPENGIKVINDDHGKSMGAAYLQVRNEDCVAAALRKHGTVSGESLIIVERCSGEEFDAAVDNYNPARSRSCSPINRSSSQSLSSEGAYAVLGNIPFYTTAEQLRKFFENLQITLNDGPYMEIFGFNQPTGRALVEFSTHQDLERACMLENEINFGFSTTVTTISKQAYEERVKAFKYLCQTENFHQFHRTANPDANVTQKHWCVGLRGLSWSTTVDTIMDFFSGLQIVTNGIHIQMDNINRAAGLAYVEFTNQADFRSALARDKQLIGSRYINVYPYSYSEMMKMFNTSHCEPDLPPKKPDEFTVRMCNLPSEVQVDDILEFFSGLNPIADSIKVQCKEGVPTGDGLVSFSTLFEASRAILDFNYKLLLRNIITINWFSEQS